MNELEAKYKDGLEELLFFAPVWGNLARSLGTPRFSMQEKTAWVEFDAAETKIIFSFNPEFIMTLDDEMLAAVILHETHHVFLSHLKELKDQVRYPDQQALIKAQECIINDGVEKVFGLPLPDFVMRGEKLAGCDMSQMNTEMGYKLFAQDKPEDSDSNDDGDPEDEGEDSSSQGPSAAGGGGAGSDAGNGGADSKPSDDEPDSDKSDDSGEDGAGKGKDDTDNGQDQDTDNADSKDADDGDKNDDDKSDVDYGDGACGGIKVPDDEFKDFAYAVAGAFKKAADSMGISVGDLEAQVSNTVAGSYSATGAVVSEEGAVSTERMNWRSLLAHINPKVLESGKPRRRTRNNWVQYNRRMGSVYPRVILPVNENVEPKNSDDDGDTLPVLVVALDLSGSIPRALVSTLRGLINEIPSDLIRAYAATWGTNLIPYNEEHNYRTAGGGTNINNVVRYVEQVERETGTKPYVLVITDGQYPVNHDRPGRDWFYMGVNRNSATYMSRIGQNKNGHEVYCVDDFKI